MQAVIQCSLRDQKTSGLLPQRQHAAPQLGNSSGGNALLQACVVRYQTAPFSGKGVLSHLKLYVKSWALSRWGAHQPLQV